jgi:hypothetical protein
MVGSAAQSESATASYQQYYCAGASPLGLEATAAAADGISSCFRHRNVASVACNNVQHPEALLLPASAAKGGNLAAGSTHQHDRPLHHQWLPPDEQHACASQHPYEHEQLQFWGGIRRPEQSVGATSAFEQVVEEWTTVLVRCLVGCLPKPTRADEAWEAWEARDLEHARDGYVVCNPAQFVCNCSGADVFEARGHSRVTLPTPPLPPPPPHRRPPSSPMRSAVATCMPGTATAVQSSAPLPGVGVPTSSYLSSASRKGSTSKTFTNDRHQGATSSRKGSASRARPPPPHAPSSDAGRKHQARTPGLQRGVSAARRQAEALGLQVLGSNSSTPREAPASHDRAIPALASRAIAPPRRDTTPRQPQPQPPPQAVTCGEAASPRVPTQQTPTPKMKIQRRAQPQALGTRQQPALSSSIADPFREPPDKWNPKVDPKEHVSRRLPKWFEAPLPKAPGVPQASSASPQQKQQPPPQPPPPHHPQHQHYHHHHQQHRHHHHHHCRQDQQIRPSRRSSSSDAFARSSGRFDDVKSDESSPRSPPIAPPSGPRVLYSTSRDIGEPTRTYDALHHLAPDAILLHPTEDRPLYDVDTTTRRSSARALSNDGAVAELFARHQHQREAHLSPGGRPIGGSSAVQQGLLPLSPPRIVTQQSLFKREEWYGHVAGPKPEGWTETLRGGLRGVTGAQHQPASGLKWERLRYPPKNGVRLRNVPLGAAILSSQTLEFTEEQIASLIPRQEERRGLTTGHFMHAGGFYFVPAPGTRAGMVDTRVRVIGLWPSDKDKQGQRL